MGALILFLFSISASAADTGYFSWQLGAHQSIVCAKSDKERGVAGDCDKPGPKDFEELFCDPKFAKGSGKQGKLNRAWLEACKKYEKSGRAEIVKNRPVKFFAWQPGPADSIQCKEVPKGLGTPGKCIYPGPKTYKELICTEQFFKHSGVKIDDDVFCKRHPWKPPVQAADDEDDGGDTNASSSANGDGSGKAVPINPNEDRGSGVSGFED